MKYIINLFLLLPIFIFNIQRIESDTDFEDDTTRINFLSYILNQSVHTTAEDSLCALLKNLSLSQFDMREAYDKELSDEKKIQLKNILM